MPTVRLLALTPISPHQVEQLLTEVPRGERSGAFALNVDSRYYLVSGEPPIHRFYILQDWWARADSIVFQEINEYFNDTQVGD